MHPDVADALRGAIRRALAAALGVPRQDEIRTIWTRSGPNSWNWQQQAYASVRSAFLGNRINWSAMAGDFPELFRQHHADHAGSGGSPGPYLNLGPDHFFQRAFIEVWDRRSRGVNEADAVEQVVREASLFVSEATVPIRCVALLQHVKLNGIDRVDLPGGLVIRSVTNEEMSAFYGPDSADMFFIMTPRPGMFHDAVIVGEVAEKKPIDGAHEESAISALLQRIRRQLVAFRVFRSGRVGAEVFRTFPIRWHPMISPQFFSDHDRVPQGHEYSLSAADISDLCAVSAAVSHPLDAALELACSRLSDAETRLVDRDRLLDAMIGLEAILLAQLGDDARRGELSYRLSHNFATLFEGAEARFHAWREARDLYGLRSTIAHGSSLSDGMCKVAGDRVPLSEAANRACEALRFTIKRFLMSSGRPAFREQHFWETALFGLPGDSAE